MRMAGTGKEADGDYGKRRRRRRSGCGGWQSDCRVWSGQTADHRNGSEWNDMFVVRHAVVGSQRLPSLVRPDDHSKKREQPIVVWTTAHHMILLEDRECLATCERQDAEPKGN